MYRHNGPISVELCAGAGGQALGLEQAGFEPEALVEIDAPSCATLRLNRPNWNVLEEDLISFDARPFYGADLVAAGLPCPPFSKAGKQLGAADERNLFPSMMRVVNEIRPPAVMIENVRGFLDPAFTEFRVHLKRTLNRFGYVVDWRLFNASDFGVSQLRPRVVIVAVKKDISEYFEWPAGAAPRPPTVGELLYDLMAENGWEGAAKWRLQAGDIAPTLVGGSKKHGGPDLGPTRARKAWAALGVDGLGIWNDAPAKNFAGIPRLTVRMCARLQGLPDTWKLSGRKTAAYRQVGNAFPPPVARAVGRRLIECLSARTFVQVA